jgi:hypothetical protein
VDGVDVRSTGRVPPVRVAHQVDGLTSHPALEQVGARADGAPRVGLEPDGAEAIQREDRERRVAQGVGELGEGVLQRDPDGVAVEGLHAECPAGRVAVLVCACDRHVQVAQIGSVGGVDDVAQAGDDVGRGDLARDRRLEQDPGPQLEGPDSRVGVRAPALSQAGHRLQGSVGLRLPSDQAFVHLVQDRVALVGLGDTGVERSRVDREGVSEGAAPLRRLVRPGVRAAARRAAAGGRDERRQDTGQKRDQQYAAEHPVAAATHRTHALHRSTHAMELKATPATLLFASR